MFDWDADGDGYLDTDARASVDNYRPIWVELTRSGTSLSASYSYDGANCVPVGRSVALTSVAAKQDAGIFSTSHDAAQSAIKQFDSGSFTAAMIP
ncbi:hypothetical protein [Streptomyces sp. NPDC059466]|uniref:hypothetical protein n=1 Tax=unclassified Streptomyces TaxID=2593676 RepID=UPI0036CCCAD6